MKWRIGELLLKKKLISWKQLEAVLEEQEKTKEITGEIFVRKGFISRRLLYKTMADEAGVRFVDLKRIRINPAAVGIIPADFACRHNIFPIEFLAGKITVAIPSPFHFWPEETVRRIKGVETLQSVLALPGEIEACLKEYYDPERLAGRGDERSRRPVSGSVSDIQGEQF